MSKHLGEEAKEGAMTIAEQLIEKGRDEGIALVAKRMMANGCDIEFIRKQVDLPLEDLMLLRDGRKQS